MRVNFAVALGALAGLIGALVGSAQHPAQVVVGVAAGSGSLAVLSLREGATAVDWFTVRLLLAGNIVVFAISNNGSLGWVLTVLLLLNAVPLLGASLWSTVAARGRRAGVGMVRERPALIRPAE